MSLIGAHGLMMSLGASGPTDPFFSDVISLCHFDGPNGSTTITDQIPARTWTLGGTGTDLETAIAKFGPSSLRLTGAGGLTSNVVSGTNFGTGDFTIEFFFRRGTISGARYIYDGRYTGSAAGNGIAIYLSGGTVNTQANTTVGSSTTIAVGTWYHIAVSRSGTDLRTFIDGNIVATQTDSRDYTAGQQIYIAQTYNIGGRSVGNLDEMRVTKGVARYTSAFTPPTAPFPDS